MPHWAAKSSGSSETRDTCVFGITSVWPRRSGMMSVSSGRHRYKDGQQKECWKVSQTTCALEGVEGNLILRGSCRSRTGCTTVPLRARCGRKDSPGRCSKLRGGRGFREPLRRKRSYLLRAAAGATVRDVQDGGRAGLDEGAGGRWAGSEQKTCLEKARLLVDNLVAPVRNTAADWRAGSAGRQEPFSSAGPAGARQRRIGPRQSDILT